MTKEEAEYVYQSVRNGTQVKPVHINRKDKSVDVTVNPYKEALTQEVDGHLHEEPSLEMKKCDPTWSILSTEIDDTTNKYGSPYTEMNSSNKLSEDEQLITEDSSDQWDERFEVSHALCIIHTSLITLMMLAPHIWEAIWPWMSQEHFQLTIIFLLMVEECQKHIFPMGHL